MRRLPYPLLCTLLGLALAWIPALLHGPIAAKFDLLYIHGAVAVWGWYWARMSIGLLVGVTHWPQRWWLRGPLCGLLAMFPLGIVSLAVPGCGAPCMLVNVTSGVTIGLVVAGVARALTGEDRAS